MQDRGLGSPPPLSLSLKAGDGVSGGLEGLEDTKELGHGEERVDTPANTGEAEISPRVPDARERADKHPKPGRVHVPYAAEVYNHVLRAIGTEGVQAINQSGAVGAAQRVASEGHDGHSVSCLGLELHHGCRVREMENLRRTGMRDTKREEQPAALCTAPLRQFAVATRRPTKVILQIELAKGPQAGRPYRAVIARRAGA